MSPDLTPEPFPLLYLRGESGHWSEDWGKWWFVCRCNSLAEEQPWPVFENYQQRQLAATSLSLFNNINPAQWLDQLTLKRWLLGNEPRLIEFQPLSAFRITAIGGNISFVDPVEQAKLEEQQWQSDCYAEVQQPATNELTSSFIDSIALPPEGLWLSTDASLKPIRHAITVRLEIDSFVDLPDLRAHREWATQTEFVHLHGRYEQQERPLEEIEDDTEQWLEQHRQENPLTAGTFLPIALEENGKKVFGVYQLTEWKPPLSRGELYLSDDDLLPRAGKLLTRTARWSVCGLAKSLTKILGTICENRTWTA
ncbi:MAG: hypothetical protein CMJ46_03710 [Planctomyces sp.]|nr:hypothetical protein [Planctomyces sp.]